MCPCFSSDPSKLTCSLHPDPKLNSPYKVSPLLLGSIGGTGVHSTHHHAGTIHLGISFPSWVCHPCALCLLPADIPLSLFLQGRSGFNSPPEGSWPAVLDQGVLSGRAPHKYSCACELRKKCSQEKCNQLGKQEPRMWS